MSLEQSLAEYVVDGRAERSPPAAVAVARAAIRDGIGVMLAGSRSRAARIVAGLVRDDGGRAESTILGQGFAAPVTGAALANGTATHALDFDDSHHPGMIHPTAVLLPALLAVAEARHRTGRELLTAYLLSLDVTTALASVVNPAHYEAGWHPTATVGAIGAAAGAARLAGLDVAGASTAMALAATQSHGLRATFGSMGKSLHAGTAARAGVLGAVLAERGFTAGTRVISGRYGFLAVHNHGGEPGGAWADAVLDQLDHSFHRAVGGLSLKAYPSCGVTQAPIEAALRIARRADFDPRLVVRVRCQVEPFIRRVLIAEPPRDGDQARFNLPHCVAVALLDRTVGLRQFTPDRVDAPEVRALARRVRVVDAETRAPGRPGPDMRWPCSVTVEGPGGVRWSEVVDEPGGRGFGELLPEPDLVAKFGDCAGWGGVPDDVAAVIVGLLDELDDLADLTKLLQPLAGQAILDRDRTPKHNVEANVII